MEEKYRPLDHDLFIEESLIEGQGLFASKDIPQGTDLGVSHIEIEKDKMSPREMIRTPLGGFINHQPYTYIEEGQTEIDGPNCERKKSPQDGCKISWNIFTRKDIKAGEELTLCYKMYEPKDDK